MIIKDRKLLQILFADDMTISLQYDENSLRTTLEVLERFYSISGLKIQITKTQATIIGVPHFKPNWADNMEIVWKDSFKLLGINFDNLLNHMERNIDDKIEKMKGTMKKWEYKVLSPIGRQNVTKTFITSQLAHVGFVQVINNKTITKIEQMLHNFIWQKKSYCKKEDAKAKLEKGGFNLIDLKSSLKSFQISWIRRLYLNYNSNKEWVQTLKTMLKDINVEPETLWNKGTKTFNYIARKIKSNFWKKVFEIHKHAPERFRKIPAKIQIAKNNALLGSLNKKQDAN